MNPPPRVFISYSHDSAEHKKWVLDFSTTLRNRGVDAILDQWDLQPGDDLPHFMETHLEGADYVLMICTEQYVEKANKGEGGVGYEKMIITSTLLSKIDVNKVIPIIRQSGTDNRPTFLKSKLYINFSNDADLEYNLDDLLRVLLKAPLYEKPKIGANPFKPMEGSRPDRTSDAIKEIMTVISALFENREQNFVRFKNIVDNVSLHRLTLDKYMEIAINQGLIRRSSDKGLVYITQEGINYLISHNIIED